ncbi:twin-arginine translocase TatA/TatE family subunit [Calditrichota bacterium]
MFGLGTTELIIIMFIILLVFGAKKLPELAQGLGRGIREFKKASTDIQSELKVDDDYEAPKPKSKIQSNEKDTAESKES